MSEEKKGIDIIPNREDLFSVGFAALGAWAMKKGNPGMEAVEQLVAVLLGKAMAGTIDSTDGFGGPDQTLKEHDLFTAGIRAGVSLFQKGGQQQVMFSAFSGFASNIMGRWVNTRVVPGKKGDVSA